MNIILNTSALDFTLLSYGYDELMRRKAEKGLADIWTREFINKNINEVWFRCDEDLVDIAHEYGLGAILNQFAIHDIDPIPGIDILNDKRVKIELDEYDIDERLIIELA